MKSFMLTFCFAVAIDGLSVDAGAKTSLLSQDVSVKAAHAKHHAKHASVHAKAEHEAKVNLLMAQNPQATKVLCDACVAAEEDLVGNQTVLTHALGNQSSASSALGDARALYDTCTDEQTALHNTMDTLERALRGRLTTGITELSSLKSMLESTLFEVNVPDADGAYASANPDRSYDGSGLLVQIDAWRTAFNNHATKVAECNTKRSTVDALENSLTGNNTAVTNAEAAVQAANVTTVQACDAMRNGLASNCDVLYRGGERTTGEYTLDLDGDGQGELAYCEMEKDGGGWTFAIKTYYQANICVTSDVQAGEKHICNTAGCLQAKIDYVLQHVAGNAQERENENANYKISDAKIKAIIGQPNSGETSKFDVMYTQTGVNTGYSTGNYEYATIKDYTAEWTFAVKMPESTTTTTLDVFRVSDNALAHRTRFDCGREAGQTGGGINCYGPSGAADAGAQCAINMGTRTNSGWNHWYMCNSNQDTYEYICNGPQHSSSYRVTHMYWFRPARSDNPV